MNKRLIFAWCLTGLWLLLWIILIYQGWENIKKLNFNEWGDFLAGMTAPLAFLWLVIGYFQQGDELRQNTEALRQQEKTLIEQVKELEMQRKVQESLVKATRQSVEMTRFVKR